MGTFGPIPPMKVTGETKVDIAEGEHLVVHGARGRPPGYRGARRAATVYPHSRSISGASPAGDPSTPEITVGGPPMDDFEERSADLLRGMATRSPRKVGI